MPKRIPTRTGVRAIVKKGNKYLMVRRAESSGAGFWQFAGGKTDGEKPLSALRRELKEETNISFKGAKRKSMLYNKKHNFHTIYYQVSRPTGKIKLQKEELDRHKWVTKSEMNKMRKLTEGAKRIRGRL